jgi:serine/threonine protein kinase/formylglycine-generating enzyme required for sulfatase activity
MEPGRWKLLERIFDAALAIPEAERPGFLAASCGEDHELRREVEKLLQSDASALLQPAPGALAGLLAGSLLEVEEDAARSDLPGPIGPYRPVAVLGEGGMGIVYLAEQEAPLRRRVALKLIRGSRGTSEVVRRFRSEIETLAQMSHPGIARVHDAGTAPDGSPFFVMEYVEGGMPLTTYCDERSLGIRARLELFLGLCEAVQHAHQKGVIHRDLKPSNVLVTEEQGVPHPKVIDFGIARAVGPQALENSLVTETGRILGTPAYMSPEQASGGRIAVDTRTDIYSLGAILYELLVGVSPLALELRGASVLDILLAVREKEPLTPSLRLTRLGEDSTVAAARRRSEPALLRRELRGDLDWISLKALEKDPERRYSSVSELGADLRRHLSDQPVLAGPPGAGYRLRKLLRRHRWQIVPALVALTLLAAAAATSWILALRESHAQLARGAEARRELAAQRDRSAQLERQWRELKARSRSFQPPWEREEELDAWRELGERQKGVEAHFNAAATAFSLALESAPVLSRLDVAARSALRDLYFDRYRESLEKGGVVLPPELFKGLIESLGAEQYAQALSGVERLAIESEPPGADVHCFRFEVHEARLVPRPYHPRLGSLGEPLLQVASVRAGEAPFEPGDLLLYIVRDGAPVPVASLGQLARALAAVAADEVVEAVVRRRGDEVSLRWQPFPRARTSGLLGPGRLLDVREQLGLTFEGYPLELRPETLLGRTREGAPLEVDLAAGSYLLVLRREGHVDVRLPVAVPGGAGEHRARLYRPEEIPPGFVLVAGGRFPAGGDAEAYEGLGARTEDVPDFFISRLEVTVGEYLEFLNDPGTLQRLAAGGGTGRVAPAVEWGTGALRILRPQESSGQPPAVDLIPRADRTALVRERGGGYELAAAVDARWPLLGVSLFASLEYARWLTLRHGSRWQFRLPDDFEWEKAARGADRRKHVWGEYPLHAFAHTRLGAYPREGAAASDILPVGSHPMDESVHGVLDLAGSVSEPVITDPLRIPYTLRFVTVRGANWDATDARDLHAATRNRVLPERQVRHVGLRLVASPAPR